MSSCMDVVKVLDASEAPETTRCDARVVSVDTWRDAGQDTKLVSLDRIGSSVGIRAKCEVAVVRGVEVMVGDVVVLAPSAGAAGALASDVDSSFDEAIDSLEYADESDCCDADTGRSGGESICAVASGGSGAKAGVSACERGRGGRAGLYSSGNKGGMDRGERTAGSTRGVDAASDGAVDVVPADGGSDVRLTDCELSDTSAASARRGGSTGEAVWRSLGDANELDRGRCCDRAGVVGTAGTRRSSVSLREECTRNGRGIDAALRTDEARETVVGSASVECVASSLSPSLEYTDSSECSSLPSSSSSSLSWSSEPAFEGRRDSLWPERVLRKLE